jgi:hypothetical protein
VLPESLQPLDAGAVPGPAGGGSVVPDGEAELLERRDVSPAERDEHQRRAGNDAYRRRDEAEPHEEADRRVLAVATVDVPEDETSCGKQDGDPGPRGAPNLRPRAGHATTRHRGDRFWI